MFLKYKAWKSHSGKEPERPAFETDIESESAE